jgi:hypothetical protein
MSKELKFHPLADLFPLMQGEEFDALVADIAANGLREKIDLYQGKIVDGRNRYRALQRLGIDPSAEPGKYFRKAIYAHSVGGEIAPHERNNNDSVRAYVVSKNIHRRHLTAEQKRELIAKLVKAQPEKSDRAIGKMAKVDGKTVAAVRAEQEERAEIPHVEKRIDTKGRKQPAAKKPPKVQPGTSPKRDIVKEAFDLVLRMNDEQRAKFFDLYLERYGDKKYRGKFTEAWREGESKAAPQPKPARGRPKGSKNKPKSPPVADTAAPQCGGDNAPPPEVGAGIMKAKLAALDHGADPGPMPEIIRRTA